MKVGIVGAGRIGGGIARQFAGAGHEVLLSFSRDPQSLERLAAEIGPGATTGSPAEAVGFGEVVVISVPWGTWPQALEQMGSLAGKIVIDTTNQFGAPPLPAAGETAAHFNAGRLPGARYTKSFNTLTSAFQAQTAARPGDEKVVQWLCGDDAEAKQVVAGLITDAGFVPCRPRRHGGLCGNGGAAPPRRGLRRGVPRGRRPGGGRGGPGRTHHPADPAVLSGRQQLSPARPCWPSSYGVTPRPNTPTADRRRPGPGRPGPAARSRPGRLGPAARSRPGRLGPAAVAALAALVLLPVAALAALVLPVAALVLAALVLLPVAALTPLVLPVAALVLAALVLLPVAALAPLVLAALALAVLILLAALVMLHELLCVVLQVLELAHDYFPP